MNKKHFIRFDLTEEKPKTKVWAICSTEDEQFLGSIYWYGPWRQYIFEPSDSTLWHKGCLQDVVEFLDKVNREHREKRNEKNSG